MSPLFINHLDLSKQYFRRLLKFGDIVIDATCGNGHDTEYLALQILTEKSGLLYTLDIQDKALDLAKMRIQEKFSTAINQRIHFLKRCHSSFPEEILKKSVQLIVYNLGYLPGGNKEITTKSVTTLKSIQNALELISETGAICITCYPAHPAGEIEEQLILEFMKGLDYHEWICCHHRFINREKSPSLILIQRTLKAPHSCSKTV